jgi:hypothetical protein
MKTKPGLVLILMFMMLAQAACAPSASVPVAASATTSVCPTATADTKLLTSTHDGYCLLYPAEDSAAMPGWVVINPNSAPGDVPGDAWVYIQVQDAAGKTAAAVAEEAIAAVGTGFNITKTEIAIDGDQAIVIDGLPGQDSNRIVMIERNNRLYTLTFAPWQPSAAGSGQTTPLEHLYDTVIKSIHFMPPT